MNYSFKTRRFSLGVSTIIFVFLSFGFASTPLAQTSTDARPLNQDILTISAAFSEARRKRKKSINLEDIKLAIKKRNARHHASRLMKVIEMDLDGDGFVTVTEADSFKNNSSVQSPIYGVRRPIEINDILRNPDRLNSAHQRRNALAVVHAEAILKRFDKNNDGEITSEEQRSVTQAFIKKRVPDRSKTTGQERKKWAALAQASAILGTGMAHRSIGPQDGKIDETFEISREAFEVAGKIHLSRLRHEEMKNVMPLDLNGDGSLEKSELELIFNPRLLSKIPLLRKLNEDKQKQSYSYIEITAIADGLVLDKNEGLENFSTLFNHMDTDGSGFITVEEWKAAR